MNKFKQVSSDGHQMPLAMEAGTGGGPMSGGGEGPGPGSPTSGGVGGGVLGMYNEL